MRIGPEASTVAPFPFAALPSIRRADLAARAALRASTEGAGLRATRIAEVLSELTGEDVALAFEGARALEVGRIGEDAVGVAIAPAGGCGLDRGALFELEAALAAVLVAKALRQRAPRVAVAGRAPAPALAGAVGAVVHTALRRSFADASLRVVSAGPARTLARDLSAAHGRLATGTLRVMIGRDAYAASVSVPFDDPIPARHDRLSRRELTALDAMPIGLPLVAATWIARRADVDALQIGDAIVGLTFPLRLSSANELIGPVALVPPASESGLPANLAEGGRLVLRTERAESHPWDRLRWPNEEPAMSADTNATLEVLTDAPVVVRVELGAVEMTAREWAALTDGDVVTLGRRLGEPATLRVGGVAVARGELVQVDGEYGVRILARGGA